MSTISLSTQPEYAIGLQPILDHTGNLAGYEILAHVSGGLVTHDTPFRPLSPQIIEDLFEHRGFVETMPAFPWWIKVAPDTLGTEVLDALPAGSLVLELRGQNWDPSIAERCEQIRTRGHKVVCWTGAREYLDLSAIVPVVDGIKVTFRDCQLDSAATYVDEFRHLRVPIIAESVNHPEIARICVENGCRYAQGLHFAHPVSRANAPLEASESALLRLLGLAMSDAQTSEIVEVLKTQPDISLRLLELLKTAAFTNSTPPRNLSQALVMLGRERLKRWILLLMFAQSRNKAVRFPSPLLMLAAMRGRMMELAAQEIGHGQRNGHEHGDGSGQRTGEGSSHELMQAQAPSPEQAFLVGMLSVMSAQFQQPSEDLIQGLSLAPEMQEALLHRGGPLGALLFMVEEIEQPGFLDAQYSMSQIDELPAATVVDLQLSAVEWAFSLMPQGRA